MKNITITILSILLLITGGYLLYDKVLMEEDNQNINDNENNEIINDNSNYTMETFADEVYGTADGKARLTLWANGTYSFIKLIPAEGGLYFTYEEASLGRYNVIDSEIHLDYIFDINQGKDKKDNQDDYVTISNKTNILKINSKKEQQIEIKVDDLTLVHLEQPAYEGPDSGFYNELKFYLNHME